MTARRIDQIWLFGGLALTILLVAGGWFMLIKPQYTAIDAVHADTGDTQTQLIKEQKRLAELKAELKKINQYKKTLLTNQQAIPHDDSTNRIPEFLKQLQSLGARYKVEVSGYGATTEVPSKSPDTVTQLPITLSIDGQNVDRILNLVKHLQTEQPRALLIETAQLGQGDEGWELSLTLKAFITSTKTATVKS
ncbi:type 4a pilus biogenesis protein PilO [Actinoplanes xinjiangensis]|uniref:type 4a pilus biogenesis protein PilO n=1 Tax=Actinoplanes xinjiangensis TaxID=512350 RepID=UPI00342A52CB